MQRCREVGASDYLLKPIKQSELLEAISRLLRSKTSESTVAPTTPVDRDSIGRRSLSILVVEDNAVNQTLMREILTKQGHRITAAENGQEAIDLVIQHPFDVILMDLQMPVMGGIESTRQIRQWEQSCDPARRTPIIALTAHALQSDRAMCQQAGMDDYVTKPIQVDQLFVAIERVVGSSCVSVNKKPAMQATDETPILAENELLERVGHDISILKLLVSLFLEDAPKRVDEIRAAIDQQNIEKLNAAAHSLKGLAGNIGGMKTFKVAASLEKAARDQDLQSCVEHFAEIQATLDELSAPLETLCSNFEKQTSGVR
jgi:CheY-like chemotaxis protein